VRLHGAEQRQANECKLTINAHGIRHTLASVTFRDAELKYVELTNENGLILDSEEYTLYHMKIKTFTITV